MALVHEVFNAMRKDDFKLTWHTDLDEVLGAQIQAVGDGIVLHQADYVNKIISTYASAIDQHEALLRGQVQTPCTAYLAKDVIDAQESKIQTIADLDPKFATRYRSLVGGLLYASVVSNPDISYTVGQLCRAMSFPTIIAAGRQRRPALRQDTATQRACCLNVSPRGQLLIAAPQKQNARRVTDKARAQGQGSDRHPTLIPPPKRSAGTRLTTSTNTD
jgi:hypothetical protein